MRIRRGRSCHAKRSERAAPLPGDALLQPCTGSATHAITIRRPRREVWPWLLQMGAGRAGWYSYDFIDNGREHSAERVIPELQDVDVGSIMPGVPGTKDAFMVLSVEPEHCLILCVVSPDDAHLMVTWAFVLEEPEPGVTRLIVRARVGRGYHPPFGLPMWAMRSLVKWGHGIMQAKQLRGIARRAEAV
ncbi:MAG TPA: hypothetical protein VFU01_04950 [Gemmatimonadaceae bacterium]|nr:hypothetical protein [Gemmatimonadaceae bacterium]